MLGILRPCQGGDPIPLPRARMVIGRKFGCDIVVPSSNVSSKHCELEFTDGLWYARDLESTHGTRIDGKVCQYECIKPGSTLTVGRERFTLHYEPSGAAANKKSLTKSLLSIAGLEPKAKQAVPVPAAKSTTSQKPSSAATETEKELDPKQRGVLCPLGGGLPITLSKDRMLVGRDRSCDIVLATTTISSQHCELERIDGYWQVRDLGSQNGTKVNGTTIKQKWLLPHSELQISKLRFKVLYLPPVNAPVPKGAHGSLTRNLLERTGLLKRR